MSPSEKAQSQLEEWKSSLARLPGGVYSVSQDRPYLFDESAYSKEALQSDGQSPGGQLIKLFLQLGGDTRGPALELGCGHGYVSAGLAAQNIFPELIISDASTTFVEMCRKQIPASSAVSYAVINCDDIDKLPDETFSLITLANTLHHLENYQTIIGVIHRKLRSGGIFIFQEPIGNGLIILGLMLHNLFYARGYHHQSLVKRLKVKLWGAGKNDLSVLESVQVSNFAQFVAEVCRRDLPKGHLEDKHMFMADEFFRIGNSIGFRVHSYLNRFLSDVQNQGHSGTSFENFCRGYFEHCLGWDAPLREKILRLLAPQIAYIQTLSRGRESPATHGVFCFMK